MKAMNVLLVSLIAGSCASVASAGGDDVTRSVPLRPAMTRIRTLDMSGNGGFGTRASQSMTYYSNFDDAVINWTLAPTLGEPIFLEMGGTANVGGSPVTIGPVAAPAKLNSFDLSFVTHDINSSTDHSTSDVVFSIELWSDTIDYLFLGSTCAPTGDDSVAQNSPSFPYGMGALGFSFGPLTNQYGWNATNIDITTAYTIPYFNWSVADGNCFIDVRFWSDTTFTTYGSVAFPGYNAPPGGNCGTGTTNPGSYPTLGYSFNNMYLDNDANFVYNRGERFFFGNDQPVIANMRVVLRGDDGCTDSDGNGFINGDDAAYMGEIELTGCAY